MATCWVSGRPLGAGADVVVAVGGPGCSWWDMACGRATVERGEFDGRWWVRGVRWPDHPGRRLVIAGREFDRLAGPAGGEPAALPAAFRRVAAQVLKDGRHAAADWQAAPTREG